MNPSVVRPRTPASYWLWAVFALTVYFALMISFDRSLFAPRPGRVIEEADGFEQTIIAFLTQDDTQPLWLWARFAVISPLLYANELPNTSMLQAIYLLVYSLPVVFWAPPGAPRRVAQLILLLVPVFISFRLAMSIYSVSFCLMFVMDRRISPWTFLWFSFAMFLSSSTMLIFLIYFPLLVVKRIRDNALHQKLLLWVLYFIVLDQFLDKAIGLFTRSLEGEVLSTASTAGLDYSGSTSGFFMAMLTGNPFFTAVVTGQYDRLLLLLPTMVVAPVLLMNLNQRGDRRLLVFILILLASMLSEGVGSYAVGIVLFIILVHRRVFFRPLPRGRRPSNPVLHSTISAQPATSS